MEISSSQFLTNEPTVTTGLRISHELPSLFTVSFFSRKNVDQIQRTLVTRTKSISGVSIGYQDESELIQIMAGMYVTYGPRYDVSTLTGMVVAECLKQILAGVKSYAGYVRDASAPYGGAGETAFERPVMASTKGSKILPGFLELHRNAS